MNKNIYIIILLIFNLFFIWYLSIPTPTLPKLPSSAQSDLPGDTIQLKNVSAYYTNLTRTEIINFYKANYHGIFRIHLNHPPERAKEIIRDTTQSYYFEEFILPFKESLFINGYEWENDVFTKPEKRQQNKLIFKDREYKTKVTIKTIPTPLWSRYLAFFLTQAGLISIGLIYIRIIKNND